MILKRKGRRGDARKAATGVTGMKMRRDPAGKTPWSAKYGYRGITIEAKAAPRKRGRVEMTVAKSIATGKTAGGESE